MKSNKKEHDKYPWFKYYEEENKDFDVIFVGDCEVYENFSPVVLWEKYGINSDSKKSIRIAYSEALKLRNEIKTLERPATEEIAEDSSTSKQAEKKKARLQKKESGKKHYSGHGHRRSYRRR